MHPHYKLAQKVTLHQLTAEATSTCPNAVHTVEKGAVGVTVIRKSSRADAPASKAAEAYGRQSRSEECTLNILTQFVLVSSALVA
jgi:hypothetical protein